jgi:hypothetical protein
MLGRGIVKVQPLGGFRGVGGNVGRMFGRVVLHNCQDRSAQMLLKFGTLAGAVTDTEGPHKCQNAPSTIVSSTSIVSAASVVSPAMNRDAVALLEQITFRRVFSRNAA